MVDSISINRYKYQPYHRSNHNLDRVWYFIPLKIANSSSWIGTEGIATEVALTTITTELTPEAPLVSPPPPYHVSTRTTTAKLSAAVVAVETALAIIKLELGVATIDAGKMTALRIVIFTEKALEEEEVSGR
ncbi:Uncharacterized protein Rs2_07004 [Raphanus sativus]|nr:Uncharacterized protein Rs2_07004 [Raphanus sativus]